MPLPEWSFLRRTGYGSRKRAERLGLKLPVLSPYWQDNPNRDPTVERVRAYRRRHPSPPVPRHRGQVRVHEYIRRRAGSGLPRLGETESTREWIAYLADFYKITETEARRLERASRP